MGLDMYLYRDHYVGAHYEHNKTQVTLSILIDGKPAFTDIDPKKINSIREQVGYWRKANAIHNWFVREVQGGRDECQESEVSREQLLELLAKCREVVTKAIVEAGKIHIGTTYSQGKKTEDYIDGEIIANAEEISEILTSREGFFFGSTEYNQYYLQDIHDTIKMLEALGIESPEHEGEYCYRASW